MKILLTGGAGYIGSHTAIELIQSGHDVVIMDDLSNSSAEVIRRIEDITKTTIPFVKADVRNKVELEEVFASQQIDAVIHFAGFKAVGESVAKPLEYYDNNLVSSLVLLETMKKYHVNKIVFSSSATVYGTPESLPLTEESPTGRGITNPYGQTKFMIEQILQDAAVANPELEVSILRYFNPIGAHASGTIGEDPNGIPNNLLPYVAQVAVGKLNEVGVFGDDYDTPDGTGVRDYIHVVDLARGHVAALEHMKSAVNIYNLGTGHGTSVLEIIKAFSQASGHDIPYVIKPRRPGDLAACYANCDKAQRELNWKAELSVEQACQDTWNWQSNNPNGYQS